MNCQGNDLAPERKSKFKIEVLTAVDMNVAIFWGIALCEPTFRRNVSPHAARWILALQIFDPKDGGDTFLRNVGSHMDYNKQVIGGLFDRAFEVLKTFRSP
jgi:hypothetical protein